MTSGSAFILANGSRSADRQRRSSSRSVSIRGPCRTGPFPSITEVIGALEIELHLPAVRSLKEKRAVLRPIIESSRSRYRVAIAETGYQDLHQRAVIEVAAVASAGRVVTEELDAVERLVWSSPGVEVIASRRWWSEEE